MFTQSFFLKGKYKADCVKEIPAHASDDCGSCSSNSNYKCGKGKRNAAVYDAKKGKYELRSNHVFHICWIIILKTAKKEWLYM